MRRMVTTMLLLSAALSAVGATVGVRKKPAGEWELLVDGRPYLVRGMTYRVTKVGQSPDHGNLQDWAEYDFNGNGRCDGPYDAWVDRNGNNRQDPDEPVVGDFTLLERMGVNTIRWYHNDFRNQVPHKALFRDLFQTHGIRVAVGDKFGAYTLGSGASWNEGTDYRNPQHRKNMLESVRRMVMDHKDEPYTLMWILGNENNYGFTNTNASKYPDDYAKFLNEAARMIHQLDGKHPVAFVNGDTQLLSAYKKHCPDIDIFGTNCYRGPRGFGSLWTQVRGSLDKPVLVAEYGGAEAAGIDEDKQAAYHRGCWLDIEANAAGGKGAGNSIGGMAYAWNDEWWKAGDPSGQAQRGATGAQAGGSARWDQEYCGVTGQGDGSASPFLRRLRKIYFIYQELWKATPETKATP